MNPNELYQQTILDHNKNPRNTGCLQNPSHQAEGNNPLCGDNIFITLKIKNEASIENIAYQSNGCAISKASASLMSQRVKGMNIRDFYKLFSIFKALIRGELKKEQEKNYLEKLTIFSGIYQYPSRVKCAILPWYTLKSALEKKQKSISTENNY